MKLLPIRTHVVHIHDGSEMTYGLYLRLLTWTIDKLHNHKERLTDRLWDR